MCSVVQADHFLSAYYQKLFTSSNYSGVNPFTLTLMTSSRFYYLAIFGTTLTARPTSTEYLDFSLKNYWVTYSSNLSFYFQHSVSYFSFSVSQDFFSYSDLHSASFSLLAFFQALCYEFKLDMEVSAYEYLYIWNNLSQILPRIWFNLTPTTYMSSSLESFY